MTQRKVRLGPAVKTAPVVEDVRGLSRDGLSVADVVDRLIATRKPSDSLTDTSGFANRLYPLEQEEIQKRIERAFEEFVICCYICEKPTTESEGARSIVFEDDGKYRWLCWECRVGK